jgi:hypothetical protein
MATVETPAAAGVSTCVLHFCGCTGGAALRFTSSSSGATRLDFDEKERLPLVFHFSLRPIASPCLQ